ncbi:MAG: VOC family protein [Cyanobacteria bacterium P01_E01_bin.6]
MTFPVMALSHIELYVSDVVTMERFYTDVLGFVVTDRGAGSSGMVFLSRSPEEHHQLVLNPRPANTRSDSPVDHISFRVSSLSDLRRFYLSVFSSEIPVDSVSHGTTWSIYFRDPEGNRLEIFMDTPWYVHQPCKFKVDLTQSEEELYVFIEATIAEMPGYCAVEDWRHTHVSMMGR